MGGGLEAPALKGGDPSPGSKMGGFAECHGPLLRLLGRLGRHFFEVVFFDGFFDPFLVPFGTQTRAKIDKKSARSMSKRPSIFGPLFHRFLIVRGSQTGRPEPKNHRTSIGFNSI